MVYALAGSNKIGPEGPTTGYENPATLYLVPDLNMLPKKLRKLEITSPIAYQPLLQQHLNVLR
jgi:hypothetical protein